jgi:trigger factor
MTCFPEVQPGDISGAEVELPAVSIAKADEERELDEIRERNAIVMDKEDSAKAKKGDIATVDYAELDAAGAARQRQRAPGFRLRDRHRL